MPSYTLEIEAIGYYLTDIPVLEIWSESFLNSSHNILQTGALISLTLPYGGVLPSSLEFRFDDGQAEAGRTVEIQSVKINGRAINVGNFLSLETLLQTVTSIVDTATSGFLFDSTEPLLSVFTPVTYAMTLNNDQVRIYDTADYIFDGLDGRDTFFMGDGNDKVNGNDGNDLIRGGGGHDLLFGAEGDDRLFGQDGDDVLYGGNGNDTVYGEAGNDEIHGGAGNDRLNGHDGDDIITGGDGDDRLGGGSGGDFLYGDAGADQIIAGDDDDTVDGGAGNDIIYGGSGNDILDGGDDNDVLSGDAGDDILNGGAGDDFLYGDAGADSLRGGDGADILYSGSQQTIDTAVSNILSSNFGVSYNADTNSFYQYVSGGISWSGAVASASAATLTGLTGIQGHLVTATSSTENSYLYALSGGNAVWLSASDAATEGEWIWTSGPEAGQKFWTGGLLGFLYNSLFSDWGILNPSNVLSNRDYAELTTASNLGIFQGNRKPWLYYRMGSGFIIERR